MAHSRTGALVAAVFVLGIGIGGPTPPATAATTYRVLAGGESPDGSTQVNQFLPASFSVNVGDTVTWRVASTEFHNVVFLSGAPRPPFIAASPLGPALHPLAAFPIGGPTYDGSGIAGSGLLNRDDTFSLTFTTAGTFPYVCTIHREMNGTVTVRPVGEGVSGQPLLDIVGEAELDRALARHGVPVIVSNTQTAHAEGGVAVVAGAGDGVVAVNRFLPANTLVRPGEYVTWLNKDPETPHTVTFLAGEPAPAVVLPVPQAAGPPILRLSPAALFPSSDSREYGGEGPLHSGFLANEPPFPATYTLRFTEAGTYPYLCILHPDMVGTVTVLHQPDED